MKFSLILIAVLSLTAAFCAEVVLKKIEKCATCNGTGEVVCPTCKGSRQEPCNACHGTGRLSYGTYGISCMCGNGKMNCYTCRYLGAGASLGKVTCPDCKGKKFK
ncbi:MAG: hypothetical protein IJT50_02125 [Lentisphaeria bacterium]|nr:hypothetical protein [Lentisphaeria bacterium]